MPAGLRYRADDDRPLTRETDKSIGYGDAAVHERTEPAGTSDVGRAEGRGRAGKGRRGGNPKELRGP